MPGKALPYAENADSGIAACPGSSREDGKFHLKTLKGKLLSKPECDACLSVSRRSTSPSCIRMPTHPAITSGQIHVYIVHSHSPPVGKAVDLFAVFIGAGWSLGLDSAVNSLVLPPQNTGPVIFSR
jgi:hypothetical protein